MLEKTLLLVKPDGVARGLVDEIKKRIAAAGLKIVESKELQLTRAMAEDLYSIHQGKSFYDGLVKFMTGGPLVANVIEAEGAISKLREVMGATDPRNAGAGTIRGDLKEDNIFTADKTMKNLVHGSDSPESAKRELGIFFPHPPSPSP